MRPHLHCRNVILTSGKANSSGDTGLTGPAQRDSAENWHQRVRGWHIKESAAFLGGEIMPVKKGSKQLNCHIFSNGVEPFLCDLCARDRWKKALCPVSPVCLEASFSSTH